MTQQTQLAESLRALHHKDEPLLLPNAWDVATALLLEQIGFEAIGTTSAGVAWALGRPDGERIGRDEMVSAIARICHAVTVPVTADIEGGYGHTPNAMASTIAAVIDAGAVGVNIEDAMVGDPPGLRPLPQQVELLGAARRTAKAAGVPLLINARTDLFWLQVGPEEERVENTIARLCAYKDAGADVVFAPGLRDDDSIARVSRSVGLPLNVLAVPGLSDIARLSELGVARVSLGSGLARAALGHVRKVASTLRATGQWQSMLEDALAYDHVNGLPFAAPAPEG